MQVKTVPTGLQSIQTFIGHKSKFKGRLKFSDSLLVDGRFEGTITSRGMLVVGSRAEIKAQVEVATVIVSGHIVGDVVASHRLELLPGGSISGDVRCKSLVMSEGAEIQGLCEMLDKPEGLDIFSRPLDRLRKNLEYAL